MAHLRDAYRDAVAYLVAAGRQDGRGMRAIEDNTVCDRCLLESLGQIGARLGDRDQAQAAAEDALRELQEGLDGLD